MTELDTAAERKHVSQLHKFNHVDNLALACRAYLDHIDRLQAENQRLTDLNRRALAIIADAIMHGMPITEEVAAVCNGIVRGEESLRALTKEAGE